MHLESKNILFFLTQDKDSQKIFKTFSICSLWGSVAFALEIDRSLAVCDTLITLTSRFKAEQRLF